MQTNAYKSPSDRLQGSYVPLPEVKHANPVCNIVFVVVLPAGQYGSTSIIYREAQKGMWKLESAVMNCQVSESSGVILQNALPAPLLLTMFGLLLRDTPLLRPLTSLQVQLSYHEMFHKLNISDVNNCLSSPLQEHMTSQQKFRKKAFMIYKPLHHPHLFL